MTDTIASLDAARSRGLGQSEPWPEPDRTLLQDAPPPPPRMPVEVFGAAADYLKRAGRGANVAPDYPAAMLLAAVGALVGKSYQVRVSTDWFEPIAVWSVMVGPPSSGKTPACKPIRNKLFRLQSALAELHRTSIERDLKYAEADNEPAHQIARLRESLEQPPRYVVNDSTSEALARVEARSPRGLLVERDELAGLIEGLERYSAGVDRAFYLEGWNGGTFSLDRVKAGTITIPDHCFSIAGGIQPDRLRSLLTHSGDDDGFMARLLVFWPASLPAGPVPKGADHTIMEAALDRIEALEVKSDIGRQTLCFAPDAFTAFNDWYQTARAERLETMGKAGSAFGKLPGYAARLAGILHVLDWAFTIDQNALPDTIEAKHISAALSLIEDYFVPQIRRVYHGADQPQEDQIAAAILQHCLKQNLRVMNLRTARREWSISGCRSNNAAKLFKDAAAALVEAGWLRPQTRQGGATDFAINPALHKGA